MFLFDLIANGVVLVLLSGGGIIAYQDYRRGFPLGKSFLGKAEKIYLKLSGAKPDGPVEHARNAVMLQEARVEKLRKSVALIAATSQVAYEESRQEILIAEKFERTKIEALQKNNEEIAEAAALAQLEALRRADIQIEFSEKYGIRTKYLEKQLNQQERELLLMKDKKSTIEVRTQVTEGMNALYQLLSDVEAETGVPTPRLMLEDQLKQSRLNELTAGNLISLAENRKKIEGKELPQYASVSLEQIQGEINILQKRLIAIPEKAGDAVIN